MLAGMCKTNRSAVFIPNLKTLIWSSRRAKQSRTRWWLPACWVSWLVSSRLKLLSHGDDTGSTPVRDANTFHYSRDLAVTPQVQKNPLTKLLPSEYLQESSVPLVIV